MLKNNRNYNLYYLQKQYNQACEPLEHKTLRHRDCGYQDYAYERRQEAIEYHGEALEDFELWCKQALELYHEAVFEFEFWKQMQDAASQIADESRPSGPWASADEAQANFEYQEAKKNLRYYEAVIKQLMGNALSAMCEDIFDTGPGPRPTYPRFHILVPETDFEYAYVFSDNDIPF